MFIFDYVDPFILLISLCVGLLYTYLYVPKPSIIIKYPTPFNSDTIKYVDDAGVCYKYKVEKTECPANKAEIKTLPIQQK